MKRLIAWTILSSWLIHVFVPILYRLYYGDYPHHMQNLGFVPDDTATKVAIIITAVHAVSILLIYFIPVKNRQVIPVYKGSVGYFYIVMLAASGMMVLLSSGSYADVLAGSLNASVYTYFLMFFNPQMLFLMYLFCIDGKKNIILFISAYLSYTLFTFSRQGVLVIALNAMGYLLCVQEGRLRSLKRQTLETIKKNKKIFKAVILVMAMIGPFLFVYSSNNRGTISSDETHTVGETIAARCSCLETAGFALYKYDHGNYDRKVFLDKYGMRNQMECIIDSSVPGSIFTGDVDPNQYFRYIFGYMSYEDARTHYSSVNFMFPIYLAVKYGYLFGIVLSIVLIVICSVMILNMKNIYLQVCMTCVVFKGVLYYFDWVMIWRDLLTAVATVLTYELLTKYILNHPFRMKRVTMGG